MDQGDIDTLRAERLAWYADSIGQSDVAHPAGPLVGDSAKDTAGASMGCVILGLGIVYFGNLIDLALTSGHSEVAQGARLAMAACGIGIPLLVWYIRSRSGLAELDNGLARPWLDLREALRLGSVEPANPAWGVALAHAGRVQELLRKVTAVGGSRHVPAVSAEVQEAGALVWATGEAWRRQQAGLRPGRAVSPLDRLPPVVGPSIAQASAASDAAADAATEVLDMGDYDLDFDHFARRRASMYHRASGSQPRCPDPRQPLPDRATEQSVWGTVSFVVFLVSALAAGLLLAAEQLWWSLAAVVPALGSVGYALVGQTTDDQPDTVSMSPQLGMAWQDYLDAVAYADSGDAPVTTVEAIRSCEQRVRAILVELTAPTVSPTEGTPLTRELYRLCSEAWTLVGQEKAEQRLIDEGDSGDTLSAS